MGKTISITLPRPIEKFFQDRAIERDVSRSRVIVEILENYYNNNLYVSNFKHIAEKGVNTNFVPNNYEHLETSLDYAMKLLKDSLKIKIIKVHNKSEFNWRIKGAKEFSVDSHLTVETKMASIPLFLKQVVSPMVQKMVDWLNKEYKDEYVLLPYTIKNLTSCAKYTDNLGLCMYFSVGKRGKPDKLYMKFALIEKNDYENYIKGLKI
jgi:hypothetical protein